MPARQPTCQAFQLRRTSNSWIHTNPMCSHDQTEVLI